MPACGHKPANTWMPTGVCCNKTRMEIHGADYLPCTERVGGGGAHDRRGSQSDQENCEALTKKGQRCSSMRGVYALVIWVSTPTKVQTGRLGPLTFDPGAWVYVGSAMGDGSTSLENRLNRHFRRNKTPHWHIDRLLLAGGAVRYAVFATSDVGEECRVAQALREDERFRIGPRGFGSSDCRAHCGTHIFQYLGQARLKDVLTEIFASLGLVAQTFSAKDDSQTTPWWEC